jgi:protein SCO1/2
MARPSVFTDSFETGKECLFMKRVKWQILAWIGLISAFLLLLWVRPAKAGSTRWGADYFPNVPLTTQDGKTVHFYDDLLKGKVVAIALIYTQCQDQCPLETARMAEVQRMLGDHMGKDIFFYSISIDPEHDTPEVLKAYAQKFHAGPGWLFLTGKPSDIELISKKLGLYSDPDPRNRDGHTADLMVGNVSTGQWMRNAATDNPRFLSITLEQFLGSMHTAAASNNYNTVSSLNMTAGQYLFATQCAACHTIGQGTHIGPDLADVTTRRPREWLAQFIQTPDKLLSERDPTATALFSEYKQVRMPNLRLSSGDVKAILDYLESARTGKTNKPTYSSRSHN